MTLLGSYKENKIDRLGRTYAHRVLQLQCDVCLCEFEHRGNNLARVEKRRRHCCSFACRRQANRLGGHIRKKTEETCQRRYGAKTPLSAPDCLERGRKTCLQRYGVEHPGAAPELIKRRTQTNLERYGERSFLATEQCRRRLRDPEVVRRKTTSINKTDWAERASKSHATMKKRGTYCRSLPEDKFFQVLCDLFGEASVRRQVTINTWPIDFYIENIDTYVQFDGVYWHGLDRPIEVIAEHRTPRDVVIHGKWLTDRRQDEWFVANHLTLVRVTDRELAECNDISTLIKGRLS